MWATFLALTVIGAATGVWMFGAATMGPKRPLAPDWVATVSVIADDAAWGEPYGLAAGRDGTLIVADGANGHRIVTATSSGAIIAVVGGREGFEDGQGAAARFSTPSGVAVDSAGVIYVADTGNDAVRRVTPDGQVVTVATGLNGPIGIAVGRDDRLFVADSYNDRVVTLERDGRVVPLLIDEPLDTPTGLAVSTQGTLYVADTGNRVIRAIAPDGNVWSLDASSIGGLHRPIAVSVDATGAIFVTDEPGRVIEIAPSGQARIVAGGEAGYANGLGHEARFRRLAGIVALEPGRLVIADAGNRLLRSVTATTLAELRPPPSPMIDPDFDVDSFTYTPLLWPLEPLGGPFEVAGTIGEARGAGADRFHAGIDVRAENGAPVLAVRDGVVTSPLAAGDFGSLNEWLRIGELTYVHLRVGRTLRNELVNTQLFVGTRDERGHLTRVRVKRGARFHAGDVIGSVNRFNHVHLNVGWGGEEYNPLLFRLVQFADTIPPTIARGGVRLFGADGAPLTAREKGRLLVSGTVQIVVDAWDQADGNRPGRRLGVYSLGYQVLQRDGTPLPGWETPLETIRFDRLNSSPDATRLVYAPGSGIPFYGQRRTRFLYIVTNRFRAGVASPGMWDTATLPAGDYILRVRVADINGNEAVANRDVPITITGPAEPPGA